MVLAPRRSARTVLHFVVLCSFLWSLWPVTPVDAAPVTTRSKTLAVARDSRAIATTPEFFYGQNTTSDGRNIVLQWSGSAARMGGYDVYRSIDGSSARLVGTTSFPTDVSAFLAAMRSAPDELAALEQIYSPTGLYTDTASIATIYDTIASVNTLLDKPSRTVTETTAINLTRAAVQRLPQLAHVVGLGFDDVVLRAPTGVVLYSIRKAGTNTEIGTILVQPDGVSTNIPMPTGLREAGVYDGPADVGIIGSTRAATMPERYDSAVMQHEVANDGVVYLTWTKGSITNGRMVRGYHVYRAAAGAGSWLRLTDTPVIIGAGQPNGPSTLTVPGSRMVVPAYYDEPFFYADAQLSTPSDYRTWQYKVCPVDIADKEGTCSASISAVKRDLIPPTQVDTFTAETVYPSTPASTAKLVLRWQYTDLDRSGIGDTPTFFVTRAITTGVKLADWTPVATVRAPARGTVSVTTDTPATNTPYWYRIQVRDNAGNWSSPSRPVRGAIFDRTPPAQPVIANENKSACLSAFPSRLIPPAEVRQVVLYRRIGTGTWVLIKRFRPVGKVGASVALEDPYIPPQTNTPVNYRIEYQDANGNISAPTLFCLRRGSPNGVATPRFTVDVRTQEKRGTLATVDFGTTSDVVSRTVRIDRPTSLGATSVVSTTVNGAQSTFAFPIEIGESLRVGASARALTVTTDISSTLNSTWIRNVNNFLNLDITPKSNVFLDAPRNMAPLGSINVSWGSSNDENCYEKSSPPRKVCLWISAVGYGKTEQPPLAAVFRRVAPSSIQYSAADVPWLQVTPITTWRRSRDTTRWYLEDTTLMDPTRVYEYVVIGHSARSYEAIGYFTTAILNAASARNSEPADIGVPVDTTGWVSGLPRGCIDGLTAVALPVTLARQSMLPPSWFTYDPTSGAATAVLNVVDLGHDWSFTIDGVYSSRSRRCSLPSAAATNVQLFLKGTLRAGTQVINDAMIIQATVTAGKITDARFSTSFDQADASAHITSAVSGGIALDLARIAFIADAAGVVTNTTTISTTLPAHLSVQVATGDPLASPDRAGMLRIHVDNFSGAYDSATLGAAAASNLSYPKTPSATDPQVVLNDEYAPWMFRVAERVGIPVDLAALELNQIRGESRFSYTQPSISSKIPDNNTAFVGNQSDPTRDYVYEGSGIVINTTGLQGDLGRVGPLEYVTAYPAGFLVRAFDAAFTLQDSRILNGEMNSMGIVFDSYVRDTDTTYARTIGGRPVLVQGHYLAPDRLATVVPSFSKQTTTLSLSGPLRFGANGSILQTVTSSSVLQWPGFSLKTDGPALELTLMVAPAVPRGMSSYGVGLPKPVQSPWEQVDRGLPDQSDFDPGLNIHGSNDVSYGCYGDGSFTAQFDAYVRYGGFSEHIVLDGLGGAGIKNATTGYDESLDTFSAIYVDNLIVDPSDIRSTLILPYPSDVSLPLRLTSFDSKGCPVGGSVGGTSGVDLTHSYWNFDQHATQFGYDASTSTRTRYARQYLRTRGVLLPTPSELASALTQVPAMILQIEGTLFPMAARDANNAAAGLHGVSEWLPDGEYGNITLTEGQQVFVSGMPFTPNDILLSRYHAVLLDKTAAPSTLGFGPTVSPSMPAKIKDGSGNLTQASLAACAANVATRIGCGIQLLDGNTAMSTFGETQKCTGSGITCVNGGGTPAFRSPRAAPPEAELPSGAGSIGSAGTNSATGDTLWNPVVAQFVWDQGSTMLDLNLPLVFIANRQGGVLAGMLKNVSVLPTPAELFKTDVSVIVNGRLNSGVFTTDVGAYFGYSASQAAFRALATHRPNSTNTGFTAFSSWNDVKDDVKKWSKTFGYGTYDGTNNDDDPVDLLEDMWTGSGGKTWDNAGPSGSTANHNDYLDTFQYVESKLLSAKATEKYTDATRGITPLKQGSILGNACVSLKNGHGAAAFSINSLGEFSLTQIAFGSYMDVMRMGTGSCSTTDNMLHVERVSLNLTKDGEITFLANHVQSDVLSTDVYFDVQLIVGTASGNQRVEGGIKVYQITLASVRFDNIGVVFGIGLYSGNRVGYFGFTGAGTFKNVGASAQFLIGTLPGSSTVLKAQYPSLMAKLAADRGTATVYSGLYISVSISVPIYNNGCTLEVIATGEVRGWKMKEITTVGTDIYGGYISARLSAEVACLVSAAGQVLLEISQVGAVMTFTGQAWVAGGVGDCEPSTWTSWGGRWWGDSWCQQAGAVVDVQYVDTPPAWTVDYDLAVESLW